MPSTLPMRSSRPKSLRTRRCCAPSKRDVKESSVRTPSARAPLQPRWQKTGMAQQRTRSAPCVPTPSSSP
eukprot:13876439-Alexandrium_andersonii.AAC.1